MTKRFESSVEKQIREAQERGEFDNLPGLGKPLPDHNELNDPEWWAKQLMAREGLSGALPSTLRLRKEIEDLPEKIARLATADEVRDRVAQLNDRIRAAQRGPIDGPPVAFRTVDPENAVREWQRRRAR